MTAALLRTNEPSPPKWSVDFCRTEPSLAVPGDLERTLLALMDDVAATGHLLWPPTELFMAANSIDWPTRTSDDPAYETRSFRL